MTADRSRPEERCIADGCPKAAERGRKFCSGHRKREKQHKTVDTPLREWGTDPGEYLRTKALELAEAADDARAYRLAWQRLHFAAVAYVRRSYRQKVPTTPDTGERGDSKGEGK